MKAKTIALMLAGALAAPLAATADTAYVVRSFDNPMLPNPTGARGADDLRTWGPELYGQPGTAISAAPDAMNHSFVVSEFSPPPAVVYSTPAPAPDVTVVVPNDTVVVVPSY